MTADDLDLPAIAPPKPRRSVRADVLHRVTAAWDARLQGMTWERTATIAGYSDASNCRKAVMSVFGELPKIEREHLRDVWRDRIEKAHEIVSQDMVDRLPGATTAFVRIADRAAKLDGLDEPARFSLTPSDAELHAWVETALSANGHAPLPEEGDIFDVEIVDDD